MLEGGGARAPFADAVADLAPGSQGVRPPGADHSPWELLEHLRLTQLDILEYSRDPGGYHPRGWPDDYWPADQAPPDPQAWDASCRQFESDRRAMVALLEDPQRDLTAPLAPGNDHTLLRQAVLLADHDAYHLGQLVLVRKLLGAWG
ncbi:MAG: DinB family protein [Candidatus Krumholzibacteriia bacterium]